MTALYERPTEQTPLPPMEPLPLLCESCNVRTATITGTIPGQPDPDLATIDIPFALCGPCSVLDPAWVGTIVEPIDWRHLLNTCLILAGCATAYLWVVLGTATI